MYFRTAQGGDYVGQPEKLPGYEGDSHPAGHGHGCGADCLPPRHWQDYSGETSVIDPK